MKQSYNCAYRLYEILSQITAIEDVNKPMEDIWGELLDISALDRKAILKAQIELLELIEEVNVQIKNVGVSNSAIYTNHLNVFANKFFGLHPKNNNIQQLRAIIPPRVIEQAQMCSDLLSSNPASAGGEKRLSDEQLNDLLHEVQTLSNLVFEVEIDNELKAYLVTCLSKFEAAIKMYRLHGSEGFIEFLQGQMGSLYFHQDVLKKTDDESKKVKDAFFGLIGKVNDMVQFAQNTSALLPEVTNVVKDFLN